MASVKIFTFFGLIALGFLIPSEVAADGRPLMNLEFVRADSMDGENPGDLYGTVKVDEGTSTYTFYDRSSGNSETVRRDEFATLTDPAEFLFPVSAASAFSITVDLYDYDLLSQDDKVAQGTISWDTTRQNYDTHLRTPVFGENGRVMVGYSALSSALGVTIKVVLVNGDGENPADVYGTIQASQVLGDSEGAIPFFHKSRPQFVLVRPGDPIPLDRTVIAASTSTTLKITVDLWDFDSLSPDDRIAQGSVEFTVQPGEQNQYISGPYGQVQVFVTFE